MVRIAVLLAALQPMRADGESVPESPAEVAATEEAEAPPEPSGAEQPDVTADGVDPPAEPSGVEQALGVPSTNTTDPFRKTSVPGFPPEIDLNDESTWVGLKPAEKDKLRAIRAGIRAKMAESAPGPAGPTDDERAPATKRRESSSDPGNSKAAWWEARDRQLVAATIGFGVTWAVSLAATGIILAINAQNADDCSTASNTLSETDVDRCSEGATQSANLIVPAAIFGTVAGISLIGTIVSGSLLGGHRNSRGFVVAGPRSFGLGWTGRF